MRLPCPTLQVWGALLLYIFRSPTPQVWGALLGYCLVGILY